MSALDTAPPAPRRLLKAEQIRELTLMLAILLLIGILTFFRRDFVRWENLRDILDNSALTVIAACGMTAVIVAAQIDISVGASMAVAAVLAALAASKGWPPPAALAVAVGAGAMIGAVNGTLVALLKIPSIVATLATMGGLRGLLVLTTRGEWIEVSAPLQAAGDWSLLGLSLAFWAALAVALTTGLLMARSRFGRRFYAAGSNPRSAALSGIPVARVTFLSFVILGALVGLAGFLHVTRYSPIDPKPLPGFELEVITAVVIGGTDIFGGRGTVLGSVLGAILLAVIGVGLTFMGSFVQGMRSEFQPAILGLLILAAVLYTSLSRREA